MVYGSYNYSYWTYKPTYNWGASHCRDMTLTYPIGMLYRGWFMTSFTSAETVWMMKHQTRARSAKQHQKNFIIHLSKFKKREITPWNDTCDVCFFKLFSFKWNGFYHVLMNLGEATRRLNPPKKMVFLLVGHSLTQGLNCPWWILDTCKKKDVFKLHTVHFIIDIHW